MDLTTSPQKAPPRLYTCKELKTIVSNFYAKPSDYLIRTYFKIFNIYDGPLYDKYLRRFNNIIFNNFPEIDKNLTLTIFLSKAAELVRRELSSVSYLSCIFPTFEKSPSPVFVQFFNPDKGLEHRVLAYISEASSLATVLSANEVIEKVVGYCGDYCYRDPASRKTLGNQVINIRVLIRRKVLDLPYADRFTCMLFDLLLDYLPDDPSVSLRKLGETAMGMSGNSQILLELVSRYKVWLESGEHILASSFTEYVIKNFNPINSYLEPCQYLPNSIGTLFSSVLQRFFLVFMSEIFYEVEKIQLTDNSAIVYYFHLKRIKDLFKSYEDNNYIPVRAYKYFNDEMDNLVAHKQLDPMKHSDQVFKLTKELTQNVNDTYSRAVKYIEALLSQFDHLEAHSWILLNDLPLKGFDIHKSYHSIHEKPCTSCEDLLEEVKVLNSVVAKVPLVEIDCVVTKWILLLKKCQLPRISKLLEYLLSLPAYCKIMDGEISGCQYGCAQKTIRLNMAGVKSEDVVDKVEEFFEDYWEQVEEIVGKNQIRLLVE